MGWGILLPCRDTIGIFYNLSRHNVRNKAKSDGSIVLYHGITYLAFHLANRGGGSCGVMVKAMDCRIVVSEFVLQSHYYVHFWANTLGKGMNPLILPAMG